MRKSAIVSVVLLATLLAFGPVALAQEHGLEVPLETPGPGWKTCPRCENDAHVADERKKANVDTRTFNPHDISGVWGHGGPQFNALAPLDFNTVPPLTPYGQKLLDANKSDSPQWNSKDPWNICDPLGWPRDFTYSYGMEFIQLPDRVLQFFERGHTWRTIWTDGRKLPPDPPIQRFYGYAVGRWEGDTFVVESNGYDDRTWVTRYERANPDPQDPLHKPTGGEGNRFGFQYLGGFPHTTEMRVVERYKRLNYGTLQGSLTISDPKVYEKPWTTVDTVTLRPGAEIRGYDCVPSESLNFDNNSTVKSTGATDSPYLKPQ